MSVLELWDDLHYKGRWDSFRRFLCREGLHWPITFWDVRGGYSSPPEPGWACERCAKERLPYRALFWWPLVDLVRRPFYRWQDRHLSEHSGSPAAHHDPARANPKEQTGEVS